MSLQAQKLRLKAMMRQNYQHLCSRELFFLDKSFSTTQRQVLHPHTPPLSPGVMIIQASLLSGFLVIAVTNLVVPPDTRRGLKVAESCHLSQIR